MNWELSEAAMGGVLFVVCGRKTIAYSYSGEENARLISAAPDLFDALSRLCGALSESEQGEPINAIMCDAYAAIRKATAYAGE